MEDFVLPWPARRPSVQVAWLRWGNLWRRRPRLLATLAVGFLALGLLGRIRQVAHVVVLAALSPGLIAALAAVLAAILALRRGSRLANNRHHDWLAALPRDVPIAVRAGAGVLTAVLIAAVLIATLSLAARLPASIALRLIGVIAAGSAIGVVLAAAVTAANARPGRRARSHAGMQPRSRHVSMHPARLALAKRATLLPLGAWSIAEAQFRDRPTVRARSLILLLLAVPMGAPGGAVLTVAAVWLLVLHLINLTRAMLRTAFSAARWLAPTAADPLRFTVALSYRAFGAQLLAAALLLAIAAVTRGAPEVRFAARVLAVWLAAAVLLVAAACRIALHPHFGSASGRQRRGR